VTDEPRPEVVSRLAELRVFLPDRDPRDLVPDATEGEIMLAQHRAQSVAVGTVDLLTDAGLLRPPRGVLDLTVRQLYGLAFVYSQLLPLATHPTYATKRLSDLLKVVGDRERGNVIWLLDWAGFPLPEGWEVPDTLDLGGGDECA